MRTAPSRPWPNVALIALACLAPCAWADDPASGAPAHATAPSNVQPSPAEQLADDAALYRQHVDTLSNPFMEGRAPGTNGNRVAASYIEFYFRKYGLQPAFPTAMGQIPPPKDTVAPSGERGSFRQVFVAPRGGLRPGEGVVLHAQDVSWTAGGGGQPKKLVPGTDFNPLGMTGKGAVTAPLA